MAYRLKYSDYSTTTSGPPDPAAWIGPPGPQGIPGPVGPQGIPGQPTAGGPFLPLSGGSLTGPLIYTATGGTASRSAQDRAATSALTVEDFGALGDSVTDDTSAFNAYAAYLRGLPGYYIYKRFTLGSSRAYLIRGSVNLTALFNTIFEGNGSVIIASPAVAGTVTLDAIETKFLFFQNFSFISQTPNCKYAIQVGRSIAANVAQESYFSNLFFDGQFGSAAIYNRASESSNYISVIAQNRTNSPSSYSIIMDGDCSFPITSQFASTYNPSNPTVQDGQAPGTLQSFNQQTFVGCTFNSYYGPAIWMSNLRGHKYLNCYVAAYSAGGAGPAAIISYVPSGEVADLHWHVHVEPQNITTAFQIVGSVASPLIRSLYFADYYIEATTSAFILGSGVTSLTIHDLEMHIEHATHTPFNVFDNGANYTILGCRVYVGPSITFNAATVSQGMVNANGTFPLPFTTAAATNQTLSANAQTIAVPAGFTSTSISDTTGSLTGLILAPGQIPGRQFTVHNASGNNLSFDASTAVSHIVATGAVVIAPFTAKSFVLDYQNQWWPA